MIVVEVRSAELKIQTIDISGHADSGPRGYDLVCAATSAVTTGALNAFDHLFPTQTRLTQQENPARIHIEVMKNSDQLQAHLTFLIIQLKTLAEAHPNYIRIKE